jgi:WD40 repeat protein
VLRLRLSSLLATLETYEVALGCPGFAPPGRDPAAPPLSALVDAEHRHAERPLAELHARAIGRLPYPAIFRNGALSVAAPVRLELRHESVRSLASLPLDRSKLIGVADGRVLCFALDGEEHGEARACGGDVSAVICHPQFNICLALAPTGLSLFDPMRGHDEGCRFTVGSHERVHCAAFSPNGSKLAVCSDTVYIFSVDLSKAVGAAAVAREIHAPVTAVAWVNSDTVVVVGYVQAGAGAIAIVDTLSKHAVPVEVPREWGIVTGIGVEPRSGRLIFVTKGGVTAVCDMKNDYNRLVSFTHGCAVTAMASLYELFLVATEGGAIYAINLLDPKRTPDKLQIEGRVNSIVIADDMIAAAGDAGAITLWRVSRRMA